VTRLRSLLGTAAAAGNRRPLSLSFATSGGIQALNVVTGVLLARALGPAGRGELAAAMLWPGLFAVVGGLGVGEAITYHAARATSAPGTLVGSALALGAVQATVLMAGAAVTVGRVLAHQGADARTATHAYLAYVPLFFLGTYLISVLGGLRRYTAFQALRVLVIALSALGLIALAGVGALTVRTAVLVYLGANLVTAIAALCALRPWNLRLEVDGDLVRALLSFGVRSHGGNVAGMLNERLDQLVMSVFLSPASLGLYVVAVTMTSVTGLLGVSAAAVALPSVASTASAGERVYQARRLVGVTLLASTAITVPLIVALPLLIHRFFGHAYAAAIGPGRVLLVAAVALSTGRVLGAVLRALGQPLDAGRAELFALAATLLGLALLLPSLGLAGAAFTSLGAYLLSSGWMAGRVARALGVSPARLLLPDREALAVLPKIAAALAVPPQRAGTGSGQPGGRAPR
jgi:O-antigen/teichoic acid export membrane protein